MNADIIMTETRVVKCRLKWGNEHQWVTEPYVSEANYDPIDYEQENI